MIKTVFNPKAFAEVLAENIGKTLTNLANVWNIKDAI